MNRILMVSASSDLQSRFQDAAGRPIPSLPPGPLPVSPAQLFEQLGGGEIPDVIVLDARSDDGNGNGDAALDLASRLDAECPGIAVVLVSDRAAEIGFAALRSGVCDIVDPGADQAEIADVLQRAHRAAHPVLPGATGIGPDASGDGPTGRGRVISVVSPKGGVGKTTVASNLAVGLARSEPHSTVLVDLDVQFGDVGSALNLSPDHTLINVVQGPAARDSMVLKTFLTQHETGLYVVCGPASPAEADIVGVEEITQLLQTLVSEFRYVVVDTAPGLTEHTLAVMDNTDELLLVTSMDVPGVRGLRKELDILRDLGLSFNGRHVVLNFADSNTGLTRGDVEATIGTEVNIVLPRSKAAAVSVNQGIPLLQNEVRDPMTRKLRHLVDRFTPAPMRSPEPKPGRLGGRHRLRRGGKG